MAAEIYDSVKVREAAKAVKVLSEALEEGVKGAAYGALGGVEQLKGRSASALTDKLEELNVNMSRICNDLSDVSQALNRYAKALEAASQALQEEMQRG